MTKARDLANAGTALTTVSATELGYLDGVTSAVQTQLNAKQAVVSGVDSTEIGYLDGVTSAIQTQLNGKINNTLTTTTGDIIYASSANTPARLGIGSSGQILSVSGGVPAWAAAPSAGANWSLLSSTTLSGTTTTVTGISGKDKIMILIRGASSGTGSTEVNVRLNTDTGANYNYMGPSWNAPGTYSTTFLTNKGAGGVDTSIPIGAMGSGAGNVSGYCLLSGCNASGVKVYNAAGGGNSGGTGQLANNVGGWYNSATVISSISVVAAGGGSFSGGTVLVYTSA